MWLEITFNVQQVVRLGRIAMRGSHTIIVLFLMRSRQVLPLFDTQREVKEIKRNLGVKHLPQLFLLSYLDVEGKKYLLLPHLPLHPNRPYVYFFLINSLLSYYIVKLLM